MTPQETFPNQNKSYYKKYNESLMDNSIPQNMMPNFNQMNNRYNTYNNYPQMQQQNPMMNKVQQLNEEFPQIDINDGEAEEDVLAGKIYDHVELYNPK